MTVLVSRPQHDSFSKHYLSILLQADLEECHDLRQAPITSTLYFKRTSQVIIRAPRNHLYS